MKKQTLAPVVCSNCGQRADERPGFKLEEYEHLEAVFFDPGCEVEGIDTEHVISGPNLPQKLVCQNCGKSSAVPRGSISVRKEKSA